MSPRVRAYVGIGSNLDAPVAQVKRAMEALRGLPETRLAACSSLYRTAPVGITAQPEFINAVCALDTALAPQALLERLLAVEQAQGRTREGARGGPRTLDLDLLLYGDLEIDRPDLTVPHPRLHERAFVLYPLAEIAPALEVPGRGAVAELCARCGGQAVTRLADAGSPQESKA